MDLNELKKPVHSAVMVIHERLSDSLILTRRSEQLRSHPGEICFPGGTWENGDLNLYDTALRELYEELGIMADRITLIKELKPEQTLMGVIIHPWHASIESVSPYNLNIQEVTGLITIPMSAVHNRENYKDLVVERYGHRFISCEFMGNEDLVWGATARIMRQLAV